jgi:glutaredoxin
MEQKTCIIWTRPLCSLCIKVVKLLKEQGIEVEDRSIDGANWTWEQFRAASPSWSNLPTIQLPDGRILKNQKEVEEWAGKPESIYNPPVKPWSPR